MSSDAMSQSVTSRIGHVEALWRVIVAPRQTFEALEATPRWVLPLILWVILGGLTPTVMVPRLDMDALLRHQLAARGVEMSEQQIATIVENGGKPKLSSALVGAAGGAVIPLVICATLWGIFRVSGSEGPFSRAWTVTLYAAVPVIAANWAQLVIAASRDVIEVDEVGNLIKSNLTFLARGNTPNWARSLLQSVDIYTLLTVGLLSVGFSVVARRRMPFSITIVGGAWAVWACVQALLASLMG